MSRSERKAKIGFQILANRELSAENPAFGTPLLGFPRALALYVTASFFVL
ncbi:hypothetical protein [Staphylococcus sp. 11261D007BR]